MNPIDKDCHCTTCQTYTRSYLHHIATIETVSCSLLSIHNVAFQLKLMGNIRESITKDEFPQFVKQFMKEHFDDKQVPKWIVEALNKVNITL